MPKYSAVIQGAVNSEVVALAADHSTMAKFPGLGDTNFQKISKRLQVMEMKAIARIQRNWAQWHSLKSPGLSQFKPGAAHERSTKEFRLSLALDRLRNKQFTGRTTTLLHLDGMLQRLPDTSELRLAVLYGIGGVGKTQIALEYVYRFQSRYSAIFWIDGAREDVFNDSILRCLHQILSHYEINGLKTTPMWEFMNKTVNEPRQPQSGTGTPFFRSASSSYQDCFKLWLSHEENMSWLLIIDNVDDLESFNFQSVLPSTAWGSVVVTSRRSDLALTWNAIEVSEMDESESLHLLSQTTDIHFDSESSGK